MFWNEATKQYNQTMCLWQKWHTKLSNNRFRCRWINLERLSLCIALIPLCSMNPPTVQHPHFSLIALCVAFLFKILHTWKKDFLTLPTLERLINDNNPWWSCYLTCASPTMLSIFLKKTKHQSNRHCRYDSVFHAQSFLYSAVLTRPEACCLLLFAHSSFTRLC